MGLETMARTAADFPSADPHRRRGIPHGCKCWAALPQEMAALHQSLHIERVVIVTPSVYGTDNAATLAGMKARGAEARGVAVIDDKTPESELDAMHGAGVRGIRVNLATSGVSDLVLARSRLETAIDRVKGRNWHVQIYADLNVIAALKEHFAASPVPLVFDHFAGAQAALGLEQPGFADVLDLVRSGKAYVKISGAYRASKAAPGYSDVIPLAKALIAANPDRIVWGTDWPHPNSVSAIAIETSQQRCQTQIEPSGERGRSAMRFDPPTNTFAAPTPTLTSFGSDSASKLKMGSRSEPS
jgi:predicted TIM-barrel fold metal-dependent hydrolase